MDLEDGCGAVLVNHLATKLDLHLVVVRQVYLMACVDIVDTLNTRYFEELEVLAAVQMKTPTLSLSSRLLAIRT